MSAIAGILSLDGSEIDPGLVEHLTSSMSANAPDGRAHWRGRHIALGHCMLRATHEAAHEVQPLQDASHDLVLVMDGRLDNRDALQRAMRGGGIVARLESDSELVLGAYRLWGDACPEHLLGDFAFAIWDARKQELFCAVDSMGACQLYYTKTDRFFAFASTEEALLRIPGVSRAPNEQLIAHYLVPAFNSFDPASSWLRDVTVTLPGQALVVSAGRGVEVKTHWKWEPGEELRFSSLPEAQEAFFEVFGQAVRARLRANGPAAQMLSGGIDSASISAMVRRQSAWADFPGYRTYSAVSDVPATCLETQCILSLAKGVDATFLPVPSFSGMINAAEFVRDVWSYAHPCDNSLSVPALMCQAAARRGDRVMLYGASGDTTLDVPDRYIAYLLRSGAWSQAWSECVAASRNNNFLFGSRPSSLLALNAWTAYAPSALKSLVHKSVTRPRRLDDFPIDPDFALRLGVSEKLAQQHAQAVAGRTLSTTTQVDHCRYLQGPLGPSLGLAGYARLGKRYGLDMRDPWSDRRVVDFFLRLPLKYKIAQGWTKYLVRTSLAGDVESKVRWRRGKEHVGWLAISGLMEAGRIAVAGQLNQNLGLLAPYVGESYLAPRLQKFAGAIAGSQPYPELRFIHEAATLGAWLQRVSG